MEKRLLFSREIIASRVRELALRISSDYKGEEPVLLGVLNGAVFFFADLVRELSIPVKIDFIRVSSYGSRMESSGKIQMAKDVEVPIEGRPLILVEDIVDTGLTMTHLLEHLSGRGPGSISVCVLLDKLERRKAAVPIDYRGFEINEGFVVGYGLDYDEEYRDLPEIFTLK